MSDNAGITQAMIDLYDRFTHSGGTRRELMTGLARLAGGVAAAAAILPLIEARADAASLTSDTDSRITTQTIRYAGANGHAMSAYLATPTRRPDRARKVVVIHENRGLNEHIRDVTRRLALSGFVALAPDFLSPLGETPRSGDATHSADDIARELIGRLDKGATIADGVATLEWFDGYSVGSGVPGAVGFCWGGGLVNNLAVAAGKRLRVGIAYYGVAPADVAEAARVKAKLVLHYAGLDERVNAGGPAWQAALRAAGVDFAAYTYPGVNHAFNNDTSAARYDAAAARLAWQRTLDALK
ncbi:dienelactone hydrolase family protein [Sandarakinorhabdus sp. DWP1-3-1]|uniref:dienelactone hydrolase family protein n=1 Tax=Sandarakinorhabdus sp. DWP1-3-1 TaxID=2804627 RepID=UPI003CF125AE